MRSFHNRFHAGQVLARRLIQYRGLDNLLVLALPRGGVPVGFEVARRLLAPLDLYLVRKLGMPGYWELAMGALAMGGVRVLNQEVVDAFQIPASIIDGVAEIEQVELDRQQRVLRGDRPTACHRRPQGHPCRRWPGHGFDHARCSTLGQTVRTGANYRCRSRGSG